MRHLRVIHIADQIDAAMESPLVTIDHVGRDLRERVLRGDITRDEALDVIVRSLGYSSHVTAADLLGLY